MKSKSFLAMMAMFFGAETAIHDRRVIVIVRIVNFVRT